MASYSALRLPRQCLSEEIPQGIQKNTNLARMMAKDMGHLVVAQNTCFVKSVPWKEIKWMHGIISSNWKVNRMLFLQMSCKCWTGAYICSYKYVWEPWIQIFFCINSVKTVAYLSRTPRNALHAKVAVYCLKECQVTQWKRECKCGLKGKVEVLAKVTHQD